MIGVFSFILCLVAWLATTFMVLYYTESGEKVDKTVGFCLISTLIIFAIVSYL